MNRTSLKHVTPVALMCTFFLINGCGDSSNNVAVAPQTPEPPVLPVTITSFGPNAVSVWNEVAANTINIPAAATGTPEERQPNYSVDLATIHVAIYDAVIAISGTHKPYAITPTTVAVGASMDAAVSAAAYNVLRGLFPARSSVYQATYDSLLLVIPEGDAKTRGIALGAEVARGVLALRANDGRDVSLAVYVPGTAPGKFRGVNPIGRSNSNIKPFALTSAAQFRAPGPPALDSAAYVTDFNESKSMGAAVNSMRSSAQTEVARFHTEPPPRFWPRNARQFATNSQNLADNARLMALIWVAQADATIACFDSKYFFEFWRPISAIVLADGDGNLATAADATWAPVVPTPNHPEYPAAHSCVSTATAEVVRGFFRTDQISFKLDSTVADTVVHSFTSTGEFVNEIQAARIHGGMHFRTATVHGAAIGSNVAKLILDNHFLRR